MYRIPASFILVSALATPVFAQVTFEIADIHESARGQPPRMTGGALIGERYAVRNATLLDLIRKAYGMDDRSKFGADGNSRIIGGPSWLDLDRFDVIARAPRTTTREMLDQMLRTLLADRFKLVVHNDTRPLPGFALLPGSGKPKMKEADGSGEAGCQSRPDPDYFEYACRKMTMESFAEGLRAMSFSLNSPVADRTGLKGLWDFDLKWRGPENVSIFDAIDHQLGLKLQAQKIPLQVIVVERVSRKPTSNSPDVAKLPPAPPTRFELALVKLSAPGTSPRLRIRPGGRVDLQAFTLRMMIRNAWNINNDEMIANPPRFLDETRFDVTGETSAANTGKSDSATVDSEDLRLMLRALLEERFKLTTHMENRPVTAYRLVAARPKLPKADPSGRTGCKEGPGADGKDPRIAHPWLARLVTCQNITMTQFAEWLPFWAADYVKSPVMDGTGMKGEFDLTLSFSPSGLLQTSNPVAAREGEASIPDSRLSFFDALEKQLGLKLKTEKRLLPVLVIDHVEEQPTGN